MTRLQIEGFKLHVHYVARPFYTRLRTAPEAASTPERLERDLQQAKQLAAILEDEYAVLRQLKDGAPEPKIEENKKHFHSKDADVAMADEGAAEPEAVAKGEEADPGPLEKGTEAVERRIEKLVEEMQVEGELSDTSLEVKKVRVQQRENTSVRAYFFIDDACAGSVPGVSARRVQHLLLLRSGV